MRKILSHIVVVSIFTALIFVACTKDEVNLDACFSIVKTELMVGESMVFNNCSKGADEFYWDFGDGSLSNEYSPIHAYKESGQYLICLQAYKGSDVDEHKEIINVTIHKDSLKACFSYSPVEIFTKEEVIFTNCSKGGVGYSWNFGDGNISIEQNPVHVYNESGVYNVSLEIENGNYTDSYQISVIVSETLEACFSLESDNYIEGKPIFFGDCSTGADTYLWDFGDGDTYEGKTPLHVYNISGTYDVVLKVTGGIETDTYKKEVSVLSVNGSLSVEFMLDMSIEYLWGKFDLKNDFIEILGSFNEYGGGDNYKLNAIGDTGVFKIRLDGFQEGDLIDYRFRVNGIDTLSEAKNRTYSVKRNNNKVLNYYNDIDDVVFDAYKYDGLPKNGLLEVLNEDFKDTPDGFFIGRYNDFTATIENGTYIMNAESYDSGIYMKNSKYTVAQDEDFQIDCRININNGSSAILWGMNEDYYHFGFQINSDNTVAFYDFNGFSVSFSYSIDNIVPSDFNLLTVRKMGNHYYLFVNKQFITKRSVIDFYGDFFGFHAFKKQITEVDYIYVNKISTNPFKVVKKSRIINYNGEMEENLILDN